ncbi:MAG: DUF4405 domain-containing protein [Spirochaetaceae bacterium]|jgi:hypothetical protein|nr:DUF4405 domain-containing protein [Spirochaetaceae bacterium]
MEQATIAKICVDFAMTLLLLFLMAFHITGENAHMVSGAAMCVLVIVHLILNRIWVRTIHKGRYNAVRTFRLVFNILLFLTMSGLVASGIMMSPIRQFFDFFPLDIARTLHHVLAYWVFILVSIHIGIYLKKMTGMMRIKSTANTSRKYAKAVWLSIIVLITAYGLYAFVNRQIYSYMFFLNQYTFFDYDQPVYLFYIDYLAVMGAFIIIAHYSSFFVSKRFSNKANIS